MLNVKDRMCYSFDKYGQQIIKKRYPARIKQDLNAHLNKLNTNISFDISEKNKTALDKLIALCDKHHINIYFAWAPSYKKLFDYQRFNEVFLAIQKQLQQLSDDKIKFINMPPMLFEKKDLEGSIDHIINSASNKYTEALINQIEDGK